MGAGNLTLSSHGQFLSILKRKTKSVRKRKQGEREEKRERREDG